MDVAIDDIYGELEKLIGMVLKEYKISNPDDRKEVQQDVLLNLCKRLPHHEGNCRVSTLVYTIAVWRCVDHIRRSVNAPTNAQAFNVEDEILVPTDPDILEDKRALRGDRWMCTQQALIEFMNSNLRHYEALSLWNIECKTHEEVARRMRLAVSTVRNLVHVARVTLAQLCHSHCGELGCDRRVWG